MRIKEVLVVHINNMPTITSGALINQYDAMVVEVFIIISIQNA